MPSCAYQSRWVNDDVQMFRTTVRQFVQREFVPAQDRWRAQHGSDAAAWAAAFSGMIGIEGIEQNLRAAVR